MYTQNVLPFNLCRKKSLVNTNFYASRTNHYNHLKSAWLNVCILIIIHRVIMITIYWISLLRHSPMILQVRPCLHVIHGLMPAINKRTAKCVKLILTLRPSIHHMRNTLHYFLTTSCNCLKNVLYYIHFNINFDFWTYLQQFEKSHSFFVPLVYIFKKVNIKASFENVQFSLSN